MPLFMPRTILSSTSLSSCVGLQEVNSPGRQVKTELQRYTRRASPAYVPKEGSCKVPRVLPPTYSYTQLVSHHNYQNLSR